MTTIIKGKNLPSHFIVRDGEAPNFGGEGKSFIILYDQEEVNEYVEDEGDDQYLLVDSSNVERAHLFIEDGYRGHLVYEGVVKVKGVWYECDFIREGVAYRLDLDDATIESIVNK